MAMLTYRTLHIADSILCLIVFFPSMLFYWRGIWDLYGVYLFPDDTFLCNWTTFGLGCATIVGYYLHPALGVVLRDVTRPLYVIVSRVYMYGFGILAMAYWRGVWTLADYYLLEYGWIAGLVGLVLCYGSLLIARTARTVIFPPFVVSLDTRNDLLVPSTRFQTQVEWRRPSSVALYTLDAMLTHYVIMTLTVISWRSMLCMYDAMLTSLDDAVCADVVSVTTGVISCSFLLVIDDVLAKVTQHLEDRFWCQLLWEDFVVTAIFVCEAFLWRGAWNLNARYIFPDPLVGGWVNLGIGSVLLLFLQLFSYAGAVGCCLDGCLGFTVGRSSTEFQFPTRYLRHYLRSRIAKSYDVTTESDDVSLSINKNVWTVEDELTAADKVELKHGRQLAGYLPNSIGSMGDSALDLSVNNNNNSSSSSSSNGSFYHDIGDEMKIYHF